MEVKKTMVNKKEIQDFWANSPMTYGSDHGSTVYKDEYGNETIVEIGSRQFFELADNVFYGWNTDQHDDSGYFGRLFNYAKYKNKNVLEVGCGMGCMAMNWAQHGVQMTAVDLNPVAISNTIQRFETFGLQGNIQEADAETLPFPDQTFDYAYSWGVLHHTPNTGQAIDEIYRVLKPGGETGVMLYHRNSFLYRFMIDYIEGVLNMENAFLSPLELASRYGDGGRQEGNPYTWPVTKQEVYELFHLFDNIKIKVLGSDVEGIINQFAHNLGAKLPRSFVKACARRWGWSLWITGEKSS